MVVSCLKVITILVENRYFLYFVVSIRMVRVVEKARGMSGRHERRINMIFPLQMVEIVWYNFFHCCKFSAIFLQIDLMEG